MRTATEKTQSISDLQKTLQAMKKKGKKVVLCHGVFDLMHPGHILYFQAAKRHGDILVVTVTPDQFVNKGPGRPVFNQRLRLESIASLECVDYVGLNEWPTATETIERLQPHVYAKGQDYANSASDISGQIKNEMAAVIKGGGKTIFTNEEMFSSSTLINKFFNTYPPSTNQYLQRFREKHSSTELLNVLRSFSDVRVLVVGEAILDQYCYCNPMAKSPKETIVASRFLSEENFAGGTAAIANHLAGFCKSVSLVTCLGNEPRVVNFFKKSLHKSVQLHALTSADRPTVTKRRYVEPNFLTKMYEIQYLDDSPLRPAVEKKAIETLRTLLPKHDLVVVADYGHGFFTERLRNEVCSLARFLCVNTQTNSANYGFNVATKYRDANFMAIDEAELKLALRSKYGDIPGMAVRLKREVDAHVLLVSRGPHGSVVVSNGETQTETPVFSSRVVDRTGAGDALFALTSACVYKKAPPDIVGFIGNCAGSMAVEIVCNREPINPISLSKFVVGLLK